MFTVKEVSEIMSISPYTLRFYDNEGLFPDLAKKNSRRLFSEHDLEWIFYIQCLRETGMSVPEIRKYIEACKQGDSTLRERYSMLQAQRDKISSEIKVLRGCFKVLRKKLAYYDNLMNGRSVEPWRPNIKALIKKARLRSASAS